MIPEELTNLQQWVVAKADKKEAYSPKTLKLVDYRHKKKLGTYEKVLEVVKDETNEFTRLGFALKQENGLVAIDIDAGFDTCGLPTDYLVDCMNTLGSYAEYSSSKKGIHIIVKGSLPFNLGLLFAYTNDYKGELRQYNCYIITTGDTIIDGHIKKNQEGINYIINTYYVEGLKAKGLYKDYYDPNYVKHTYKDLLTNDCPNILDGARELTLLNYAGHCFKDGIDEKEILNQLEEINTNKCDPLYETKDLKKIIKKAKKLLKEGGVL